MNDRILVLYPSVKVMATLNNAKDTTLVFLIHYAEMKEGETEEKIFDNFSENNNFNETETIIIETNSDSGEKKEI